MDDKKLKELLHRFAPPPARPEARDDAIQRACQAFQEAMSREPMTRERGQVARPAAASKSPFRREWLPIAAAASVAGLAVVILIATQFFRADLDLVEVDARQESFPDETAVATFEREKEILRELEALFAGQLQFVVLKNGDTHVEVASTTVFGELPIAVELRRGDQLWRVISYSGNSIWIDLGGELLKFDVLVAGDGHVIVAGEDFIWSNRMPGMASGFAIEATAISG